MGIIRMTLKVYTKNSCASSRKVVAKLKELGIEFKEQKVNHEFLDYDNFLDVLSLTDNGVDDIITTKAIAYGELVKNGVDIEELSITELYELLKNNTSVFRTPLIHNDKKMMTGYNDSDIRMFLSKEQRILERSKMLELSNKEYNKNKHIYDELMLKEEQDNVV